MIIPFDISCQLTLFAAALSSILSVLSNPVFPFPLIPLSPGVTTSEWIVFQDDFENGFGEWESPQWMASIVSAGSDQNHIMRFMNTSDAFAVFPFPGSSWSDYILEMSVRIPRRHPSNTDLFVNVSENNSGAYTATFDIETSNVDILAEIMGDVFDLGTQTVQMPLYGWFDVRLVVFDDQIELSINGEVIQTVTSSYHREGGISFTVAPFTTVEIDDVRISRLCVCGNMFC